MNARIGRSIRTDRFETLGGKGEVCPAVNGAPILGMGNGVKAWERGGDGTGMEGVGRGRSRVGARLLTEMGARFTYAHRVSPLSARLHEHAVGVH